MALLMISRGVGGHIGFEKTAMNEILHTLQKYFLMLISTHINR